ncbi:MAG: hypothetical protein WDW38_009758 [Sanguina aurantia]
MSVSRPCSTRSAQPDRASLPYKGLLLDAAGTLLSPSESVVDVYTRYALKHGVTVESSQILSEFRSAYSQPWAKSALRYEGDGRPFWRRIVALSTGSDCPVMFESIYMYYTTAEAWTLTPGAVTALTQIRAAGLKIAVVSNFDTRLRPILKVLGAEHLFDAVVVSAEVGAEKPNPIIFEAACNQLRLLPEEVLHVGDDRRNDVWGARDAGIAALHFGLDIETFDDIATLLLTPQTSPRPAINANEPATAGSKPLEMLPPRLPHGPPHGSQRAAGTEPLVTMA